MKPYKRGNRLQAFILVSCWIFALAMSYIDTLTPRGYTDWMLYIIPSVLVSYFCPTRTALISVCVFSGLIIAGLPLSPPGPLPGGISILNRSSGVAITLFLFLLLSLLKKRNLEVEKTAFAANKNEQRLRAIFDNVAIGILEVDPGLRIIEANKQWFNSLGYLREEIIGKTVYDLTAPEDLQTTKELNASLLRGGIDELNYEKRYLHKNGARIWTHIRATAIRDSQSRVISYLGTAEDIGARKQAEDLLKKSEERYRFLFESMDEGFALCEMIFDEKKRPVDFKYIEINPAFTRLSGLTPERVIGRKVTEAISGIEPFWIETYGRIVQTGRSERIINSVLALGRYFEVVAWRIDENHFAALFSDATGRALMENELRRRAEELQLAVTELESFSYSIAHALRSPLRAIVSFSQLIDQVGGEKLDDPCKDYLARIQDAGRSIGKRMNELLAFSQLRNVVLHDTRVDLSTLARETADELAKSAPTRRVDWSIDRGLIAVGDPVLLREALRHLLENAWKFTSKKEATSIRFGKTISNGVEAFFVQDNGAGFNMTFGSRLFQPFFRLHTEQQFEGSGIGLAVVKRIIERHHGKIWVEASVNAGATFYFTLPSREARFISP